MEEKSCPISPADKAQVEVVHIHPEEKTGDYQQAMAIAKTEAEKRLGEYMLMSWYDRDRDVESPPNTTECAGDCKKDGYIHYALNHNATLKIDIEDGRFIFFFTRVEW